MSSATVEPASIYDGVRNRKGGEQRVPLAAAPTIPAENMYEEGICHPGVRMYENVFIYGGYFNYPPILKWKYVPETLKHEMREHIHSSISKQCEGGIPNQVIFVPSYVHTIHDEKKGWCGSRKPKYAVLYKHAILEYMKEKKMTDKPFLLTGDNFVRNGWTIQYVYMPETS